MIRRYVVAASAVLIAAPAPAQHGGHMMPGMTMPGMAMPASKKPAARRTAPARIKGTTSARTKATRSTPKPARSRARAPLVDPHAGHAMPDLDPHAGHTMPVPAPDPHAGHTMPSAATGTDLAAGTAPAPAMPHDNWADRRFGAVAMDAARDRMMAQDGAQRFAQAFFNIAEVAPQRGGAAYRWDGEAWYGGDRDRAVVKTEAEGRLDRGLERGEVQALFSRAIGPYHDIQTGIRQDFGPGPSRTYAVLGVEGLAPYLFETEAALFLSRHGELHARVEGWYDQRVTQRLILQPRGEIALSAQDVPSTRTGAGVSDIELGLRLRYEVTRNFAPYVGVTWEAQTGRSARYARADGDDPNRVAVAAGVRFWF